MTPSLKVLTNVLIRFLFLGIVSHLNVCYDVTAVVFLSSRVLSFQLNSKSEGLSESEFESVFDFLS